MDNKHIVDILLYFLSVETWDESTRKEILDNILKSYNGTATMDYLAFCDLVDVIQYYEPIEIKDHLLLLLMKQIGVWHKLGHPRTYGEWVARLESAPYIGTSKDNPLFRMTDQFMRQYEDND